MKKQCPARCGITENNIHDLIWHWALAHREEFDQAIDNITKRGVLK